MNQLGRARDGKLPGITEEDCLDQLALLPKVLGDDGQSMLFAVDHGDLKPANIIVDASNKHNMVSGGPLLRPTAKENRELTDNDSIVDWGFAAVVPIVQAARLPCFLWTDGTATRVPSEAMLADRQSYSSALPAPAPAPTAQAAAKVMRRWQGARDVDFCTLYLASTASKGMLASMASVGWTLPYCDFVAADDAKAVDVKG